MNNYNDHFKKMKKQTLHKEVRLNYRTNRAKPKKSNGLVLGSFCILAFGLSLYGFLYPEAIENAFKRIDIGVFAIVEAQEPEKSASPKGGKEAKSAAVDSAKASSSFSAGAPAVSTKSSYAKELADKEKELNEREKSLVELESKLQKQQAELDKKIETLEQTRRDIASRLETRVKEDEANLEKLVGVYSNMKPQAAANVISNLDEDLAVNVLKRMKKQDAGNILNFMETQKAKTISEKYSGY